jgi:hypothetical protein
MTRRTPRLLGGLLLLACGLWVNAAADDVITVSPVHWPMLLPWLTLAGIPALVGAFTAAALLFGKPGARALTLAFAITLAQAALVSYLAPEIEQRYTTVVEQGKQLVQDSLP